MPLATTLRLCNGGVTATHSSDADPRRGSDPTAPAPLPPPDTHPAPTRVMHDHDVPAHPDDLPGGTDRRTL